MRATNLILLTHFWPVLPFHNPWNQQQTFGFLVFWGGTKWEHWKEKLSEQSIPRHKKWSFPLSISSVNLTKSAGNCRFGHIYWRNLQWKTSFFVVSVRLVNPPKNEVGRLSKSIIEAMTKEFRQKLNWINGKMYKRWQWLVQEYKRKTPSQIFDIKDSYPSITGYLLEWFLNLAEKSINIYNDGKVIKVFYF